MRCQSTRRGSPETKMWRWWRMCGFKWWNPKESGFERFEWFWAFVETQLEYEVKAFPWMNRGDSILRDFDEIWYCEHASRHWTNTMCKSNHCYNCKVYVQSSKAWKNALNDSNSNCSLYTKVMFDDSLALRYTRKKYGAGDERKGRVLVLLCPCTLCKGKVVVLDCS